MQTGEQILVSDGVPVNGSSLQQIEFFTTMIHSKAARDAFAAKVKIPPQNRPAFEAQLLDLAKATIRQPKGTRKDYVIANLPALIKRNQ